MTHFSNTRVRATGRGLLGGLAVLLGTACGDFNVPNYAAGSLSELQQGAGPAAFAAAAVGMLGISRDFETSFLQSHTSVMGNFGRESLELDPSNPQHPTDRFDLIGSGEQGYVGWTTGYRLIKQGNVILGALSSATGLTDPQKEGLRGFAKTLQALALIRLSNAFDTAGMPIDVDIATTDPAAPIAAKPAVHARIAQLLDEGRTSLLAAGPAFSFTLTPGFVSQTQGTSFGTPAAFLTFNRALRARIGAYRREYPVVLTALGESFISTSPAVSLRFGAYDTYSTRPGDRANPLFDPTCRQLFALPQFETEAQTNGGTIDARFTAKVRKLTPVPAPIHSYVVNSCFRLYPSGDTPIPIIRNEELILLRAEARWFTGDKLGAMQDIDYIRTSAGGLLACGAVGSSCTVTIASTDDEFITELLYNRLYSLVFEGGHRWVDARRFNRLGTLPKNLLRAPGNTSVTKVWRYLPLPTSECLPRGNPASACAAPAPEP